MEQGKQLLEELPEHRRSQTTASNVYINVSYVDALQCGQGNTLIYLTSSDTDDVGEARQHGGESEVQIVNENKIQLYRYTISGATIVTIGNNCSVVEIKTNKEIEKKLKETGEFSVTKGDNLVSVIWRNVTWDNDSPTLTELKIDFLKDGKAFDTKELELEIFNTIREENNVRLRKLITELITTFKSQLRHIEIGCLKLVVSSMSKGHARIFEKRQAELKDLLLRTIIPESVELCIYIRLSGYEQSKSTFDSQSKQESAFKLRQEMEELQASESPDLDQLRNIRKELSNLPFDDSSHMIQFFKTIYGETDCPEPTVEVFEKFCTTRTETIRLLYGTAVDLDNLAKAVRFGQIAGTSVVSTGLIVGGLISGVFTMGLSLVLPAVAVGVATATTIGASISDSPISETRQAQINEALVKDNAALKTLCQKLEIETDEDQNMQGDVKGAASEKKAAMFAGDTSRAVVTVIMGDKPVEVISLMMLDIASLMKKSKPNIMAERFRAIAKQLEDNLRNEVMPGLCDIIDRSRE